MLGNIKSYVGDIILQIYTTQIKYTNLDKIINNPDYLILDYKNKVFSPIRGIILGRKNGRLTDKQFKQMYYDFLKESYKLNKEQWKYLLDKSKIIIASNSYYYEYADRVLLAKFLEQFSAEIKGEITI
jgi:hypothetical protein